MKRGKVEYKREKLVSNDLFYSRIPFINFPRSLKFNLAFYEYKSRLGISRDQIWLGLCIFNRHSRQAFRARIRPIPFALGQPYN